MNRSPSQQRYVRAAARRSPLSAVRSACPCGNGTGGPPPTTRNPCQPPGRQGPEQERNRSWTGLPGANVSVALTLVAHSPLCPGLQRWRAPSALIRICSGSLALQPPFDAWHSKRRQSAPADFAP